MTPDEKVGPQGTTPGDTDTNTNDEASKDNSTGEDERSETGGRQIACAELLELLGHTDGEFTAVGHRPIDGVFSSSVLKSGDATGFVNGLPCACTWFSVNPTKGPVRYGCTRGAERDVTRWAALCLDLDIKDSAFDDYDQIEKYYHDISGIVGQFPSVLIFSGHGVQPLWVIEDPDNAVLDTEEKWVEACKFSRRFGRLAATVAWRNFSKNVDTVSDLCRLMRVPGTVNVKDPEKPRPVVATMDIGGPLTLDRIEEFLDEWAPEIASDEPVTGPVLCDPMDWQFGEATCAYVRAMVPAWNRPSDKPTGGRHQWAMSRCVRLACAVRLGCLTEDDLHAALDHLELALAHWCAVMQPVRDLHAGEIRSAYRWAVAKVATFDDHRVRRELGDHKHTDPGTADWGTADPRRQPDFWAATKELATIRAFAHSRGVSAWVTLGGVLTRTITAVPPSVQLPPLVGGNASLNTFVAAMGPSGHGKSAPIAAARDAVLLPAIHTTGPGSGEGINHLFAYWDRKAKSVERIRSSTLLVVPEVDTLTALGNRQASTLLPQLLRKAWTGEELSFGYVDPAKAIPVAAHSYRLCLVVGVQTHRAGALLSDSDAGTPQRFIWLPVVDPTLPRLRPEEPEPLDLRTLGTGWPTVDPGTGRARHPAVLRFPDHIEAFIKNIQDAVVRGEYTGSPLDTHRNLCQEKVGAGLWLLHGNTEPDIAADFWELSGVLMTVSEATRKLAEDALAAEAHRQARARGRNEGLRAVAAEEVKEQEAVKKIGRQLVHILRMHNGVLSRGALRNKLHSRDRELFDLALDRLAGAVRIVMQGRKQVVQLAEGGRDDRYQQPRQ